MALRHTPNIHFYGSSKLQTPSTSEIVSIRQLKNFLRLVDDETDSSEDELLAETITISRRYIEDKTGLAFLTQTWLHTLDTWPGYQEEWWDGVRQMATTELARSSKAYAIHLPRYPAQSVSSVTVYDEAGTSSAVTVATVFDVDVNGKFGRLALKQGQTWPIATRSLNAIEIVYVAGFGDDPEDVPPPLHRALLEMAAYMYTHRGDCTPEDGYRKSSAESLIDMYRVRRL